MRGSVRKNGGPSRSPGRKPPAGTPREVQAKRPRVGAACRRRGGAGNLIAPRPPGGRPERSEGGSDSRCPRSRRRDAQARWAAQRTSRGVHAGTGEEGLRTRPSRRVRVELRCPSWVNPGAAPLPPPLPLHVGVGWMDPPRVRSLTSLAEVPWPAWVCLSRWRRWGGLAGRVPLAAAAGGPPRCSRHTRSSVPAGRGRSSKLLTLPPEHPVRAPARAPLGRSVATLAQRRSPARPRGTRQRLRPLKSAQPEDAEARRNAAAGPATPSATAAGNGRRHHRGGRPLAGPPADARRSLPGPRRRPGPGTVSAP